MGIGIAMTYVLQLKQKGIIRLNSHELFLKQLKKIKPYDLVPSIIPSSSSDDVISISFKRTVFPFTTCCFVLDFGSAGFRNVFDFRFGVGGRSFSSSSSDEVISISWSLILRLVDDAARGRRTLAGPWLPSSFPNVASPSCIVTVLHVPALNLLLLLLLPVLPFIIQAPFT
jgi:uncharacterized membrane protein (Fun14 family)